MPTRPRRALLLAGAVLVLVAFVLAALVGWRGTPELDITLLGELRPLRNGLSGSALRFVSDIGYLAVLGPVGAVAAVAAYARTRRGDVALLLAAATPIAAGVTAVTKLVVERERPTVDPEAVLHTFSMPSGHATSSAAFAAAVVLAMPSPRARRWALVPAALFAGAVGLSRNVLGVHYPSDVLAGWCMGTGISLLLAWVLLDRRIAR